MLKRNKAVSIVMAICLCLAMLAPVFVAPKSAEASCTYEVVKAPTVNSSSSAQNLGVVKVTLPDTDLFAYNTVTVELPSDIDLPNNTNGKVPVSGSVPSSSGSGAKVTIVAPGGDDGLVPADFESSSFDVDTNNSFDITMNSPVTTTGSDKYFYIYFYGVDLNNTTGDITVDFNPEPDSAFSSSSDLVIAKSTSEGSTTTSIKKVNNITDAGGTIQPITIQENTAGSLDSTDGPFTFEILTDGYSWDDSSTAASNVTYGWSLANKTGSVTADITGSDDQKLNITLPKTVLNGDTDSAAKLTFNNLFINVDDSKAKVGDEVQVKVSGYGIDKTTVVVAKYCDYTATVEAGTTETLIAGQMDQDIGDFYVEEGASGSLAENRSITFTLPSGVEWVTDDENDSSDNDNLGDYSVVNSSDIDLNAPSKATGNNEIAKWTVETPSSSTNGAKIKFKDMKVCVSPAFSGTLTITVAGSAGVEGTVDVGTVAPSATIKAGDITNVQLGKPNQKINDITITEGAAGGLLEDNDLTLKLDDGYTWAADPTVKVTTGDLDIDTANITTDDQVLTIPITGDSNTASTIVISNITLNADRTAPEGPISLQFGKSESQSDFVATATNEVPEYWNKSPGKVTIANCITAAETTGSNVFTVGSNVYESNGAKKVMDVAPYIKSSRTYVPMRYLAEMVGADVTWDQTAQTVTLTKGSIVAVFTIGSNSYTVNGTAQTADVAPEIVSSRTFLPARFVAEAFGYTVGWDQSTQTVVVSQ